MHVTGTVPRRLRPRRRPPRPPPRRGQARPPLRAARRHRPGHGQHHRRRHLPAPGLRGSVRHGQPARLRRPDRRAIALALVFGRLAHRNPRTGGPYVYAREAFGDFAGFLAAWAYWITSWVSNAALAVAAVGYLDVLVPVNDHRWTACLAALVVQWLPALANFAGTRYVGAVQLVATVLKFAPLLLVAFGGLFFFDPDNLGPFHAGGGSLTGAVSASAAILLFSYLGVESAAVSAGEVKNPRRTVGLATVIGTAGAASSTCWARCRSSAPSPRPPGGVRRALLRRGEHHVRRHLGRLGRRPGGAGVDHRLPQRLDPAERPDAVRRREGRAVPGRLRAQAARVPTVGVGVTVVLASLLTVYNYTAGSAKVFEVLVLVTTFTATVPYLLATAAQLFHLVSGRGDLVDRRRLVRDAVVASVAAAFSMWLVAGAGYAAVYQGVLFLFAGVLVHAVMAARRRRAEA